LLQVPILITADHSYMAIYNSSNKMFSVRLNNGYTATKTYENYIVGNIISSQLTRIDKNNEK
jgi:hypothetical protein